MDVSQDLPRSINIRILNRAIDFLVLGTCFFLSCLLFLGELRSGLLIQTLIYAAILLFCVRLFKRVWSGVGVSFTHIQKQILGNASGILVGTCIMLFFAKFVAGTTEMTVVMIFSSIMAFFVLGTISPLINKKTTSL